MLCFGFFVYRYLSCVVQIGFEMRCCGFCCVCCCRFVLCWMVFFWFGTVCVSVGGFVSRCTVFLFLLSNLLWICVCSLGLCMAGFGVAGGYSVVNFTLRALQYGMVPWFCNLLMLTC